MENLPKIYEFARNKNNEGIILDTVVFLLYFIGKYDTNLIHTFKPTAHYTKEDYVLLDKICKPFKKIIVTPQIITEVSKHALQAKMDKSLLHQYFCLIVDFLRNPEKTQELHFPFEEWGDKNINRLCAFGFVDMSMYELSRKKGIPILTDEVDLHAYAKEKKEVPMIKLSVVKYSGMFSQQNVEIHY